MRKLKKIQIIPKTPLMFKPDKDGKYFIDEGTGNALISFGLAKRATKSK